MPRAKTKRPATLPVIPQSMPIDDPVGWDDLVSEVEGANDAEIHVYTESGAPGAAKSAWAFSCSPADFTFTGLLERIKNDPELGPGTYSLRVRRATQWVGRRVITIAGRARPPVTAAAVAAVAAPPAPAIDLERAMLTMQLKAAEQMQTFMLSIVSKLSTPTQAGPTFGELVALVKTLQGEREARDPIKDVQRLLELRDAVQPSTIAAADDEDLEAATHKGATNADVFLKLADTFGPAIAGALSPGARATAAPAAAPPGPAASSPPAAAADEGPTPEQRIRSAVTLLLTGAARGGYPQAYAEVALDELGDDLARLVLARPNALDQLAAMAPQVTQHREWFDQVLQHARQLLEAPAETDGLTTAKTPPDAGQDDAGANH